MHTSNFGVLICTIEPQVVVVQRGAAHGFRSESIRELPLVIMSFTGRMYAI